MKPTKKKKRDLWKELENDLIGWAKFYQKRVNDAWLAYSHSAEIVKSYAKEAKKK